MAAADDIQTENTAISDRDTDKDEESDKLIKIGKLSYPTKKEILNPKSSGHRQIFKGFYNNDVSVAIQRFEINHANKEEPTLEIKREFILERLTFHENIVKYFCSEKNEDFVYIGTELCLCSVFDLFDPRNVKNVDQDRILDSLTAKEILYQATRGLEYLHQNGIVHRNVKPSSFLVKETQRTQQSSSNKQASSNYVVKISDFRLARPMDAKNPNLSGTVATEVWIAPESKDTSKPLKPSLDIFILGCFFYYVLSGFENKEKKGRDPNNHPFDEVGGKSYRELNIGEKSCAIYQDKWNPEVINNEKALKLIKKMIKYDEGERLTLSEVLQDDYFKSSSSAKEYYSLYDDKPHSKPGLCVIFNQEQYKERLARLVGAEKDYTELKLTFESLGFQVKIHQNLTKDKLNSKIEELTKMTYENYGSLVVCLLSHGTKNSIACYDGEYVDTNELQYKFCPDSCRGLEGKPKIFLIDACRTPHSNEGKVKDSTSLGTKGSVKENVDKLDLMLLQIGSPNLDPSYRFPKPLITDCIMIKSTEFGRESFINRIKGSIFTQAFCNKLKQEYKLNSNSDNEGDLEFILTGKNSVQDIMNSYVTGRREQILTWDTSLRKLIKFRKIKPIKTHSSIISQLYPFFDFLAPIIGFILLFQFTGMYSPRR